MLRHADETVTRIKEANDIVSLIEGYLPLRRRGKNLVALCPFHEEKTPSFNVNPERQTFRCFGCGKGGDVIGFVQEHEKLSFPEALSLLAERAGIRLDAVASSKANDEGPALRKVLQWAVELYRAELKSPAGAPVREYLVQRGLNAQTVTDFELGFAPPGWERVKMAARKAGFSEPLLEKAGLLVRNEQGRFYDRFRNRLMIPIFDSLKRPVGFGARVLDQSEPKYLNSPESPLFRKGNLLYGLEKVRSELGEKGKIGLVEGYTDVILSHQAGVKNVVATLGTSLTSDHAKLLSRYVNTVVLIFDGDAAGQKANARGVEILLEQDLDVRVVVLPLGMDPGDLVAEKGPEALLSALSKEEDFFEFTLRRLAATHSIETVAGKAKALEEFLGLLKKISSVVKRDLLLTQVCHRWNVRESELRARFRETENKLARGTVNQNFSLEQRWEKDREKRQEKDRKIEAELLALLLQDSSIVPFVREKIFPEDFYFSEHQSIFRDMLEQYEQEGNISLPRLMNRAIGNPTRNLLASYEGVSFEEPLKIAEQLMKAFARRKRESRILELKAQSKAARLRGDLAAAEAPFEQIHSLLRDSH